MSADTNNGFDIGGTPPRDFPDRHPDLRYLLEERSRYLHRLRLDYPTHFTDADTNELNAIEGALNSEDVYASLSQYTDAWGIVARIMATEIRQLKLALQEERQRRHSAIIEAIRLARAGRTTDTINGEVGS